MKTKEQVIQEAYGVDWDRIGSEVKLRILDQEGFILAYLIKRNECSPKYEMVGNGYMIPHSLIGIENNNGWVRFCLNNFQINDIGYDPNKHILSFWTENGYYMYEEYDNLMKYGVRVTHYKLELLDNIKPPIY